MKRIAGLSVCLLFALSGFARGGTVTVPAGESRDLGHGISIDNTQGTEAAVVEVTPESYPDPVSGDIVWILHIECVGGHVNIRDDNDTYDGPPGFENDTAVWITDDRDPPDYWYLGPGRTHGNGDVETTEPDGTLKGVNRENGVPVPGCTPG